MAKRFTDTELSDKEWFMNLSCRLKCVVRYLFDKCDSSGVWTPNYRLAAMYIGEPFTEAEILEIDNGSQFKKFGEKIFVEDFIEFQYGELSDNCNPHKPIIKKLIKYGLWKKENLRVPERVSGTLKEKEQEQEQEQDKEKDLGKFENPLPEFKNNSKSVFPFPKPHQVADLPKSKIKSTIEILQITSQIILDEFRVKIMWDVFKEQNVNGKKYYLDDEEVQKHFMNWIQKKDFKKIEKKADVSTARKIEQEKSEAILNG